MKTIMRILTAALLGLTVSSGWSQTRYTNLFSGINAPIPDGKLTGWSDTRRVKLPVAGLATNVEVRLNLSGGFNGDLYGCLVHGSGFTVLLNRPGRAATNTVGYSDSGFNVSFPVGASDDIHLYRDVTGPVSPLTGAWGTDGRVTHPLSVVDTDSRTALVASFVNVDPTGDWTLFLADVDAGGSQATLVEWSLVLEIDPNPVPLTATAHGVNRIYDTTTAATVTFTDTRGAGDDLSYTYDASFADKNIGIGKTVSVTNIVLGGLDAGRYTLVNTTATTTATISPVPLTVTGITASNKTYDGTTAATIATGSATLIGVIGGEDVTLNTAGATGAFLDKNVATAKTVQISGLTVAGGDIGNYSLAQPTATANIAAASLNVSANGTLVYGRDPTNAVYAPVYYPLQGVDTPGDISGTATFSTDATNTSYVGSNYVVTVLNTGTLSSPNYSLGVGTNGIMTVTPAPLTVTNVTANNKFYDGTTTATINTAGAGLSGLVNGDAVTLDSSSATGDFADKNVGIGKTVFCAGFATLGELGTNYSVTQPTATANISPRVVQLGGNPTYNGTTTLPAAGLSVVNNVDGGNLTLAGTARVASRNVGDQSIILTNYATPVRVRSATGNTGSGTSGSFSVNMGTAPANGNTLVAVIATRGTSAGRVTSISQSGAAWSRVAEAANGSGSTLEVWYAPNVSGAAATLTIFQATLRSAAVVIEYSGILTAGALDQTANATGNSGSPVTGTTPTTTLANELWIGGIGLVNSGYTLSAILNSFTSVASAQSTSFTSGNNAKVYALERIVSATGTANSGGSVTANNWSGAIATFRAQDSTALTLAGSAAGNYTLSGASGSATVTPAPLTVTAQANTKVYDGNTSSAANAAITAGSIQTGDSAPTWTQTYDNRNVGTGKTLTPTTLAVNDGNSGANYAVTFVNNTSGIITVKPITVTAVTNTKPYDGTTTAAGVPGISPALASGDTASFFETYNDKNAGTGKTLTPSGSVNDGNSGANYAVTFVNNTTGVITPKPITVTAVTDTKVYDGATTSAGVPTVSPGVASGDTANFAQDFDTKNVGTGKTLTPSGSVNDGNNGANYNVIFADDTTGVITPLTTAAGLVSSVNPSGPGTNVTFTVTVAGVPPAADQPTGDVVFLAGGVPFSTNGLASGVAAASTASLPVGTNAVTAEYAGDGNFLGSTGSVAQVVMNFVTCSQTNAIVGIVRNLDDTFTLTFAGTPQAEYYVLGSADAAAPMSSWLPLPGSTNTVTHPSGLWQVTVTNAAAQQYYRAAAVAPCP